MFLLCFADNIERLLFIAEEMRMKPSDWILPKPDMIHHIVEDFLTDWTATLSHINPLRNFLEEVLQLDTRWQFADECFALRLTQAELPYTCEKYYMRGRGLLAAEVHQKYLSS